MSGVCVTNLFSLLLPHNADYFYSPPPSNSKIKSQRKRRHLSKKEGKIDVCLFLHPPVDSADKKKRCLRRILNCTILCLNDILAAGGRTRVEEEICHVLLDELRDLLVCHHLMIDVWRQLRSRHNTTHFFVFVAQTLSNRVEDKHVKHVPKQRQNPRSGHK